MLIMSIMSEADAVLRPIRMCARCATSNSGHITHLTMLDQLQSYSHAPVCALRIMKTTCNVKDAA